MKKIGTLFVPIAVFLIVFVFFKQVFGNGPMNPLVMGGIIVVCLLGTSLLRPKKKISSSVDSTFSLLGDFGKEAFTYDENLSNQFQSAISDFLRSMPMAATKKLEKLQGMCKTDADTYGVSVALGMIKNYEDDYSAAIKLFNRAVVLHPTAELAEVIGAAHQRLGELEEAIDSYEFALDLDPEKIDIRAKVATAYVGNGDFLTAIDHAQQVLDLQEDHASALATIAICHGVLDHTSLYDGYTAKAVEAGYNEQKITTTVTALKKKYKKTLESLK
jgi:tetratricopeptide (TPR) repeat protein